MREFDRGKTREPRLFFPGNRLPGAPAFTFLCRTKTTFLIAMKSILFFLLSLFLLAHCARHNGRATANADLGAQITAPNSTYDAALASRAGSDPYGMKKYVMAFLKAGPNRSQDSLEAAQIQKGHLENINRLAEEGKLVLAGPFLDRGELRGIFIFNVATIEEARALTETDPAIKAGRLVMELHPWYGSAALQYVTPLHRKMEKKNVAD